MTEMGSDTQNGCQDSSMLHGQLDGNMDITMKCMSLQRLSILLQTELRFRATASSQTWTEMKRQVRMRIVKPSVFWESVLVV